ncbi:MAG: hypothetical protein ABT01_04435 [Clostridium sp. SCN 57-10]|nr:MAG: hypothetical protein ABT01_04435 [Clostridium sp. SCN 57-10]
MAPHQIIGGAHDRVPRHVLRKAGDRFPVLGRSPCVNGQHNVNLIRLNAKTIGQHHGQIGLPAASDFDNAGVQVDAAVRVKGNYGARYRVYGRIFGFPKARHTLCTNGMLLDGFGLSAVPLRERLNVGQALW